MVDGAWRSVTPGGVGEARMPYPERAEGRYLKLMLCQDIVSNRMWGRLIRRTLFTETGVRLAPGIDFSEDYSVMTRLLYFANRSTIDDTVYFYSEENTSSYTHTASPRHARSYLMACRVVLDFFHHSRLWARIPDAPAVRHDQRPAQHPPRRLPVRRWPTNCLATVPGASSSA